MTGHTLGGGLGTGGILTDQRPALAIVGSRLSLAMVLEKTQVSDLSAKRGF